jgi:hypothetical protein
MEDVQEHSAHLAQEIENVPTAFIFNVDESGFQEFVDAGKMHAMAPASYPHDSIEILAYISMKHSMLTPIRADGLYLNPMIITGREMYEIDFFEAGLTPANVLIVHGKRGFINRNLFQLWAERALFPAIERRRVEYDYEWDAVVIPDGCASHDSDWFLEEALARFVILHWLPLHSCDKT